MDITTESPTEKPKSAWKNEPVGSNVRRTGAIIYRI